VLEDAIKALKMFPNESPNAWVAWYGLVGAIATLIVCSWAFNWDVVDVRDCDMWDFRAKDVCDVVMEDGH